MDSGRRPAPLRSITDRDLKEARMTLDAGRSTISCNLCEGTTVAVLSTVSRSGKPLRTVICRACGLVWSDPRPHEAKQFYEHDYRLAYKQTYEPKPKHVLRAGKAALSRWAKIRDLFDGGPYTLLDVGTGGGEFAYLLTCLGHRVMGVEPNRGYGEYSVKEYGLTVRMGLVEEMALPEQAYDVITMWHVLEHTEDPGCVLKRVRGWLKPSGTLVVEVPNVEATCQSPKNTFHEAHLYNFNAATLQALAKKHGLEERRHELSPDRGNVTMFLSKRREAGSEPQEWALPGNYERVSRIVSGHTTLRHSLSLTPYRRIFERLRESLAEKREARGFCQGRAMLDALYCRAGVLPLDQAPRTATSLRPGWSR